MALGAGLGHSPGQDLRSCQPLVTGNDPGQG